MVWCNFRRANAKSPRSRKIIRAPLVRMNHIIRMKERGRRDYQCFVSYELETNPFAHHQLDAIACDCVPILFLAGHVSMYAFALE